MVEMISSVESLINWKIKIILIILDENMIEAMQKIKIICFLLLLWCFVRDSSLIVYFECVNDLLETKLTIFIAAFGSKPMSTRL